MTSVHVRRNPPQLRRVVESFFASWDKGSKNVRYGLLKDFISVHSGKTAAELERELNMSSCLFLSRIVAWLQMTRASQEHLHPLLEGLAVFLGAPGGSEAFVEEVVLMGGMQCILEVVRSPRAWEKDRYHGLRCLKFTVAAGLKYQVQLCQLHAISAVGESLAVSKEAKTQAMAKDVLESFPVRNEAYIGQVHSAFVQILSAQSFQARYYSAIALNSIQKQMATAPSPDIIKPLACLLECANFHVQEEVFDLMKTLLGYEEIRKPLVQCLLKALRTIDVKHATDSEDEGSDKDSASDLTPMEASLPDNIKQAACAAFIYQMLSEHHPSNQRDVAFLEILEQEHATEYLLHAFGNREFSNSRKQAALVLKELLRIGCDFVRTAVRETLGKDFVEEIEASEDLEEMSMNVSSLQSMTMRSALIRLEYAGKLL